MGEWARAPLPPEHPRGRCLSCFPVRNRLAGCSWHRGLCLDLSHPQRVPPYSLGCRGGGSCHAPGVSRANRGQSRRVACPECRASLPRYLLDGAGCNEFRDPGSGWALQVHVLQNHENPFCLDIFQLLSVITFLSTAAP